MIEPLQRKEQPDFARFLKVMRRQGDASYVPFFELVIELDYFAPLSGIEPPAGLNFMPTSPTYEASFRFYLESCARMGFDHGTINLCGFAGFPTKRHGIAGTRRNFAMADDGMITDEADFDAYRWPAVDLDVEAMARTAKMAPEGMGVMTGGPDVFSVTQDLLGVNGMSMLLYDDPALFGRVVDRVGETLLGIFALAASLPFIQGVLVTGDMGFKTGTFVSPDVLRQYFFPWHSRFVEAIHRHGKLAIMHSCGNLAAVMPDIIACGYEAKHSFEDAFTPSIFDLHAQYGHDICLLGGIDVDFLCRADEAAIRKRVRQMIDIMGPNGGYMLGSGNSITEYLPIENYRAMLDEGLRYGRPI